MRRHQQQQFDAARRDVLADGERQELEQLRLQMAALQQLLGSGGSSD
jgi:hypothetical protein